LPINHFEVNVFWHQCSVPLFKNQSKIQKGNIIDVGAYVGDSAIVMSRYTANKVYAFEPVHSNYELMLQTLKLNPEQNNIIPLNAALGKENT
ncbi:FkbM family methyltransferase, partial [Xanthomonas citri pv. citri]|nr:FkbM family methyltransferase [Xanthomonas citri pv. citri]